MPVYLDMSGRSRIKFLRWILRIRGERDAWRKRYYAEVAKSKMMAPPPFTFSLPPLQKKATPPVIPATKALTVALKKLQVAVGENMTAIDVEKATAKQKAEDKAATFAMMYGANPGKHAFISGGVMHPPAAEHGLFKFPGGHYGYKSLKKLLQSGKLIVNQDPLKLGDP